MGPLTDVVCLMCAIFFHRESYESVDGSRVVREVGRPHDFPIRLSLRCFLSAPMISSVLCRSTVFRNENGAAYKSYVSVDGCRVVFKVTSVFVREVVNVTTKFDRVFRMLLYDRIEKT